MMAPDIQQFTFAPVATDVQARAERRLRTWLAALSPNTRDAYGNDLALFAAHVGARDTSGVPLCERAVCDLITLASPDALEVAENWQAHMIATGLCSATINRRTAALNTALRNLAKVGIGPGKLDLDQVVHEARREVEAASTDGVARVVAELSASPSPDAIRDTAILLLAATRALRRSEIAALTLQDIDDAASAIRVKRKGHPSVPG